MTVNACLRTWNALLGLLQFKHWSFKWRRWLTPADLLNNHECIQMPLFLHSRCLHASGQVCIFTDVETLCNLRDSCPKFYRSLVYVSLSNPGRSVIVVVYLSCLRSWSYQQVFWICVCFFVNMRYVSWSWCGLKRLHFETDGCLIF